MEFSSFVITNKGQALMTKLMQGRGKADFTAIKLSDQVYTEEQLAGLAALSGVKQTAPITKKTVVNETTIQIEGAVDNRELNEGYSIQTIGLAATDPDDGEILYAAARATTAGYMPPGGGAAVSGGYIKLAIAVGNARQAIVEVDPAAYASMGDIAGLEVKITAINAGLEDKADKVHGHEANEVSGLQDILAGKADRPVVAQAVLTADGWTGDKAPYEQIVNAAGVTAEGVVIVGLGAGVTEQQVEVCRAARIEPSGQAEGAITLKAMGVKPSIDLPITATVVK